ncbi:MAG TPA: metallophosphoesterase [Burkholderiales bacterium]|nr:metallophosphoesterase [Burkholderiales bacterium]
MLGDTPYTEAEVGRVEGLIDQINAQPLEFVVHVGDVGSSALACRDDWLLARKAQFARIRHRFILLPGDNEWSDCKQPLERLARWREIFCATPHEFCEHRRWESGGWMFVTLNVPGHDNNLRHAEHAPRMKAVLSFLGDAASDAEGKSGLVVLMQANPFFTLPRDGFASLRDELARLGARMPGRVVLIHGDTHLHRDDEPLPGVRRIEVWGSPLVAWHRYSVSKLPLSEQSNRSSR